MLRPMRKETLARRVRFHAAYLAILMMLCEALASVWLGHMLPGFTL